MNSRTDSSIRLTNSITFFVSQVVPRAPPSFSSLIRVWERQESRLGDVVIRNGIRKVYAA